MQLTNKQKIEVLERMRETADKYDDIDGAEAIDSAITALLRTEEARKPTITLEASGIYYRCPSCHREMMYVDKDGVRWEHEQKFCDDCGQRLDWTDNETD